MAQLSIVTWGDKETLGEFLLENALQHTLFQRQLNSVGLIVPSYPLIDANVDNLDDWLQLHELVHQAEARVLNQQSPFNLLDTDWNNESDFYDWISTHLFLHEQTVATLGL